MGKRHKVAEDYLLNPLTYNPTGDYVTKSSLGAITFLIVYILPTSKGNDMKNIDQAALVCLMLKLINPPRDYSDLSRGFAGEFVEKGKNY